MDFFFFWLTPRTHFLESLHIYLAVKNIQNLIVFKDDFPFLSEMKFLEVCADFISKRG